MLRSCKHCGRVHDPKFDCGKKPKRNKQGNDKDKFRWSRKWSNKRDRIKERDKYLCQVCKQEGIYIYNDLEVHHIIPLEEDFNLRLDDDNLITLCKKHHELAESGKISREYLRGLIVDDSKTN